MHTLSLSATKSGGQPMSLNEEKLNLAAVEQDGLVSTEKDDLELILFL